MVSTTCVLDILTTVTQRSVVEFKNLLYAEAAPSLDQVQVVLERAVQSFSKNFCRHRLDSVIARVFVLLVVFCGTLPSIS